jgi:hypothetical protein
MYQGVLDHPYTKVCPAAVGVPSGSDLFGEHSNAYQIFEVYIFPV